MTGDLSSWQLGVLLGGALVGGMLLGAGIACAVLARALGRVRFPW